ncbi:hypothetical protein [Mycolicibacterium sp.]|uniref:hypothetical protein n=1 Tax=Mycolicibacterium sp. TaxID=2320850 RepID=UPI0037C77292
MTIEEQSRLHHDSPPKNPRVVRYNKLGLADPQILDAVEAQVSALRIAEIAHEAPDGAFDFAHYCYLHRRIFGSLYDWAGVPPAADDPVIDPARDVVKVLQDDLSSPSINYRKLAGRSVRDSAEYVFGHLQAEGCLLDFCPQRFPPRLAAYWCTLSSLPVFQRGNARTETVFFHQLCRAAGHRLNARELYARRTEFREARMTTGSTRARYALFSTLVDEIVEIAH